MTHGTKTFAATVPVGDRDRIRLWHVEVTIELDNLLKTAAHTIARNKSRKTRMLSRPLDRSNGDQMTTEILSYIGPLIALLIGGVFVIGLDCWGRRE
jgi:hypothetical protein